MYITSYSHWARYPRLKTWVKAKWLNFVNRYRKVTAIAATIAGFTAILISGLVSFLTPTNTNELLMLSRKVAQIQRAQHVQSNQIERNKIKSAH